MTDPNETDVKDSDILFLYDARLANPNGDPDEGNKPRVDEVTKRALVSDVRLKRYLRDYWLHTHDGDDIWVRTGEGGKVLSGKDRLGQLHDAFKEQGGDGKKKSDDFKEWLLDELVDVRLFGAVMPMRGDNITFTGPVQFSWGYSLHPVELVLSSGITSTFAGQTEQGKGEHGTMGKDWRLHYAMIGFQGNISRARAGWTGLTQEDVNLLEESLLKAIPVEATTRSKVGQVPRMYLRVDYDNEILPVGDLRDKIGFVPKDDKRPEEIRSISDYHLDMSQLLEVLQRDGVEDEISAVRFWAHPDLELDGFKGAGALPGFTRI